VKCIRVSLATWFGLSVATREAKLLIIDNRDVANEDEIITSHFADPSRGSFPQASFFRLMINGKIVELDSVLDSVKDTCGKRYSFAEMKIRN